MRQRQTWLYNVLPVTLFCSTYNVKDIALDVFRVKDLKLCSCSTKPRLNGLLLNFKLFSIWKPCDKFCSHLQWSMDHRKSSRMSLKCVQYTQAEMMFKRRLDNFMSDQTTTIFHDILFTQINIVCCLGIILR